MQLTFDSADRIDLDDWTIRDMTPLYVEDASRLETTWKDARRKCLLQLFGPDPEAREHRIDSEWVHVRSGITQHLQQLKIQRIKSSILATRPFIQTASRCKNPDKLLAEVEAMLTRHLDTEPLHSGRIETSGEVLGNEHRRHVISAEWHGLGRLPIGYIELYPTGDDWYSFELARYGTPPEVEDASPAEDFFDGLIAQLENDYPRKAQATGSGAVEVSQAFGILPANQTRELSLDFLLKHEDKKSSWYTLMCNACVDVLNHPGESPGFAQKLILTYFNVDGDSRFRKFDDIPRDEMAGELARMFLQLPDEHPRVEELKAESLGTLREWLPEDEQKALDSIGKLRLKDAVTLLEVEKYLKRFPGIGQPDPIADNGGKVKPKGEPIKPSKDDSLNPKWFDYYRACKQAHIRYTLKDIANDSNRSYGYVRQEHMKYKSEHT